MHHLAGLAGLLGLIALAFGKRSAAAVAAAIIALVLMAVTVLAVDIATGGLISDLVPRGRPNQPYRHIY